MERPAGYMLLRRAAIGSLFLGAALVLLGLVSQQGALKLVTSDQLAVEISEAEIAYHDATTSPDSAQRLEATRSRLLKARNEVVHQRNRGKAIGWWARTAGFVLVILGGVLWMAAKPGES